MKVVNIDKEYRKSSSFRIMNHYTSPEGLYGIISNGTLRLTDCAFLNDTEEYNYIFTVLDNCFLKSKKEKYRKNIEWIKNNIYKENSDFYVRKSVESGKLLFLQGKYYVLSGCKNNDELPMWNYYSKNGNYRGYCIGIDIETLSDDLKETDGILLYGKVEYNIEKQIRIIEDHIIEYYDEFEEESENLDTENAEDSGYYDSLVDEYQNRIIDFIKFIRLFFKSNDFSHENEYRIAIFASSEDKGIEKDFFIKNGIITPCIKVKLINNLPINSIIIGPTMEYELAKSGLKDLLKHYGVRKAKEKNGLQIKKSKIKIRY